MSLSLLSLTLFAATALALDATDSDASTTADPTSPSTMLIGVLAAIAMVFIFITAALILFLRSWDSMMCCKRLRRGWGASAKPKSKTRRRHFGGVAVELGEPRYPPPAYTGYEKTGAMV